MGSVDHRRVNFLLTAPGSCLSGRDLVNRGKRAWGQAVESPGDLMAFEYKCVGAPEKAKRKKGARSRSERVARAMEEIIQAEAVDGWEYQRTDLIPVEERSGLFSRAHEVHRAVLVFRRAVGAARATSAQPVQDITPGVPTPEAEDEPIRLAADRGQKAQSSTPGPRAPTGLG